MVTQANWKSISRWLPPLFVRMAFDKAQNALTNAQSALDQHERNPTYSLTILGRQELMASIEAAKNALSLAEGKTELAFQQAILSHKIKVRGRSAPAQPLAPISRVLAENLHFKFDGTARNSKTGYEFYDIQFSPSEEAPRQDAEAGQTIRSFIQGFILQSAEGTSTPADAIVGAAMDEGYHRKDIRTCIDQLIDDGELKRLPRGRRPKLPK